MKHFQGGSLLDYCLAGTGTLCPYILLKNKSSHKTTSKHLFLTAYVNVGFRVY